MGRLFSFGDICDYVLADWMIFDRKSPVEISKNLKQLTLLKSNINFMF